MNDGEWHKTAEIADNLGLKDTRTKELLKELIALDKLIDNGKTKGKLYRLNNSSFFLLKKRRKSALCEVRLMNKIIEQIEKIKQINSNENLVIFVGAGVSKNSGVCSWWELVKEIADKIGENKCTSCEIKDLLCGECGEQIEMCSINGYNCKLKYDFSAEDFLRIPQHFYESFGDTEEEKKTYYDFLKEKFCSDEYETNIIDEIIVKLQPEHIITTNYDHLLENVNDPRVSKYAIITKDNDILSKKGRNYIIKMHGDIDDIQNIVLKEDDYLNYSQNHIIIETFIKSLLIDKTFLFVGYSLNDNNLKLIMSYIDFFVKEKG